MVENLFKFINKHVFLSAALAVMLFFSLFGVTRAILVSAPGTPRLPGDTTTVEILNATILDIDIATGSPISIFKIGQITNGAIPFGSGNQLNASTTNLVYTAATNRLGVGTSTPAANLSVQGDALISGTTTTGNLVATGTFIWNGIGYTGPSANGTNGQVWTTDGKGGTSWSTTSGDDAPCATTTLTVIASRITTASTTLPSRGYYRAVVEIPHQTAINSILKLRLNNDEGSNYNSSVSQNSGVPTQNSNTTSFPLTSSNNRMHFCEVNIENRSNRRKGVLWRCVNDEGLVTDALAMHEGYGRWYNTTSPVTEIAFIADGGVGAMGVDTNLSVYCSAS